MAVKPIDWTYDPTSAEWGFMIFVIINFLVNASSWVYLIYWRDYPPIRAKQIDLLIISAAAGWMWVLGALSTTRVIPQRGAMLACNFWMFWVQLMFGAVFWICCLILRMYRLYAILVRTGYKANMMKNPKKWLYTRLAIIVFPLLVIIILFTGLNADSSTLQLISTGEYIELCSFQLWALYVSAIVALSYFGTAFYLIFSLRHIKKFLNEYKESKIAFVCIVLAFIAYVIINIQSLHYKVWGRILCCAIILFMVNFSYWTLVGSVIYGRLFHPVETLDKFIASKDYDMNSTHQSKKRASSTSGVTPGTSRNSLALKSGANSAQPSHISHESESAASAEDVEKQ